MLESASLPFLYYVCVIIVITMGLNAWKLRAQAWGVPLLAVIATAGSWYLIDPIYNDYSRYVSEVGAESLNDAWLEVLLFFISLGILSPVLNRTINKDLATGQSQIFQMMRHRSIEEPFFQDQITELAKIFVSVWCLLMVIALFRTNFDVVGLFFPYLGEKASPWGRDRIGSGVDALYALAGYIQIMLTALIGATLALSFRPSTSALAGVAYFFAAPAYIFDRTRNSMLAILLPGFMALVTLRMKGGMLMRVVVIVVGFLAIEGWMKFVIDNRDARSIAEAFKEGGTKDLEVKAKKHGGFNMFQELGYINYFIANGTYKVNWGTRYFSEIVNPIPRVIWKNKPLIGIDYAIARGMAYGDLSAKTGGVAASISTGMIGQGVVNFGRILGPIASALLMAIWVVVLARQDLMGKDIGHLLLYAFGLVLTFNMGRDITLLVIYPFLFGLIILRWIRGRGAKKLVSS